MNENIINNYDELENNTEVEVNEVVTYEEPEETSSNGIGGILAGAGLLAIGGAVGAFLYSKKKGKKSKEEKLIEKLEKKGYVVTKSSKTEENIQDVDFEEVEEVEDDAE